MVRKKEPEQEYEALLQDNRALKKERAELLRQYKILTAQIEARKQQGK